ncbi:hypothetical protein GCM10009425_13430 [Pseudomonas asuensis]|uniref:Curlin n=2 Tax=Pseudomonas asuensis TaxID=1825787 RepID=A0ABQ2GN23_9PSED|nr:hypothetical protein GCM10009425_13430 [Pseudomonas asuensis]
MRDKTVQSAIEEIAMNVLQQISLRFALLVSCLGVSIETSNAADLLNNFDLSTVSDVAARQAQGPVGQSTADRIAATVIQQGSDSQAFLIQTGLSSQALIQQIGGNHRAVMLQNGAEMTAVILQNGQGHNASIIQQGAGNQAYINQHGAYNEVLIDQDGTGLQGSVTQYGNNQSIIVRQR